MRRDAACVEDWCRTKSTIASRSILKREAPTHTLVGMQSTRGVEMTVVAYSSGMQRRHSIEEDVVVSADLSW